MNLGNIGDKEKNYKKRKKEECCRHKRKPQSNLFILSNNYCRNIELFFYDIRINA